MHRYSISILGALACAVTVGACGSSYSSGTTSHKASSGSSASSAPATGSAYGYGGGASSSGGSTSTTAATAPAAGGTAAKSVLSLMANASGSLMFNTTSLTAKAGKVTIHFMNMAPEGHDLSVQQGTGASGAVVGATGVFRGGTRTLTLTLKPGTYTFFCNVPGHRQAGMQGTIKVVGA